MKKLDASDNLLKMPVYAKAVKLRGYNAKVSVLSAVTSRDAANVLICAAPEITRKQHADLAMQHQTMANEHQQQYVTALNDAAIHLFGRPWQVSDYKVSCIGRDEFSEEEKCSLRYHGHAVAKHKALAAAHEAASISRRIH